MIQSTQTVNWRSSLKGFHERSKAGLTFLLYHGVTDQPSEGIENRQGKHITAGEFTAHMDFVSANCSPLSVNEWLLLRTERKPLPERSVIVSFDDGFANNATVAAPILKERNIPAVFYITSGIISTNIMFWVDVLEDCLNLCSKKSIRVCLDKEHDFPTGTDDERFASLLAIKGWCKKVSALEKDRVLKEVEASTGVDPLVNHAPNYRKATWSQLKKLHADPLFTIGGHSLYHNILSSLDDRALELEIRGSLDLLESNLGERPKHYSYPEGQAHHYDERTVSLLKAEGIVCSPSAMCGLNDPHDDPFHLRRIMVGFEQIPFPFWEDSL